jgi:hypothetical protein
MLSGPKINKTMITHLPVGAFLALYFPGIITAPIAQAVDGCSVLVDWLIKDLPFFGSV